MELILKMMNCEQGLLYVECNAKDSVVDVTEIMKIWTTLEVGENLEEKSKMKILKSVEVDEISNTEVDEILEQLIK